MKETPRIELDDEARRLLRVVKQQLDDLGDANSAEDRGASEWAERTRQHALEMLLKLLCDNEVRLKPLLPELHRMLLIENKADSVMGFWWYDFSNQIKELLGP